MRHFFSIVSAMLIAGAGHAPAPAAEDSTPATAKRPVWDESLNGPLPRWPAGKRLPLPPSRALQPYAVARRQAHMAPASGVIASAPEYGSTGGVVFRYTTEAWPEVVTACVTALTADAAHDEIAVVIVPDPAQQESAAAQFLAAGADLDKVQFISLPTDSIWVRDYGPHFIWQSGTRAVVDSHYFHNRTLDNFVPTLLADDVFLIPSYDIPLYYTGGNFQAAAQSHGFITSLTLSDNADIAEDMIAELLQRYQGIDVLHILPQLPWSVDSTGHLDMWMYVVDEDTVMISEFIPGSDPTAIEITENAVSYMQGLGFEVFRVPDSCGTHPMNPQGAHFTYTNAFRVNDRIFIPHYGAGGPAHGERDQAAQAAYQAAAPEAQIVPIDCWDLIWAGGAIHCIVKQVPVYGALQPSAHLRSPHGGELLVAGTTHDLLWSADDDHGVAGVDLLFSADGGFSFTDVIAEDEVNDGHFAWLVPELLTVDAVIKVVAHDGDGHTAEAVSADTFDLLSVAQMTYDFSSGAGQDKWGWGYQTPSWTFIDGARHPGALGTELDAEAYLRIAVSDAAGGDADPGRYISPLPTSGFESTHIFEFIINEAPGSILDLGITWEGYADRCTQMALYVWDHVQGNWGDGLGHWGQHHHLDSFAGNRDAVLGGHIRQEVERYIDPDGMLTILLHAGRFGDSSFHDAVAVTVTVAAEADLDGDGDVDPADLAVLLGSWGPCEGCPGDLTGDGTVAADDLAMLLGDWGP